MGFLGTEEREENTRADDGSGGVEHTGNIIKTLIFTLTLPLCNTSPD